MLRLSIAILTLALIPTLATAQVELGPIGGFYSPTSDFTMPSSNPGFGGEAVGKHQTAFAFGAAARVWLDRKFGVEGAFLRSASDVVLSPGFATVPDTVLGAHLTLGSVSAVMRLPVGDLPNPILLSAGAVFITHGGRAYRDLENSSTMGGALGLGTQFPLLSNLRIDVGFKGLLYSLSLRDSVGTLPSRFQADLLGWAGIMLRLGRNHDD